MNISIAISRDRKLTKLRKKGIVLGLLLIVTASIYAYLLDDDD